jgi:hypothetical protein
MVTAGSSLFVSGNSILQGSLTVTGITTLNDKLTISGTTTILSSLNVAGNVTATDLYATSDIRLKTNIQTISNPLDKVMKLRGVEFEMIQDKSKKIGLIAQEVEQILPEVVNQSSDIKTVSYGNIVGLLIEAIKELNHRIDDLENKFTKQ